MFRFNLLAVFALPLSLAANINNRTAQEVIDRLNLTANIERGYFIESFRDADNATAANRSASTAIYYLLKGIEGYSRWHRVDAVEIWHYYAGAPLTLSLSRNDGSGVRDVSLGPDVFKEQSPQVVIPKWEWQQARSWGEWTLVGTTVAPGFEVDGFELAEDGWAPI
ncbi:hypothetical protein OQA88_18 [Cercophora sp. LCS_1]